MEPSVLWLLLQEGEVHLRARPMDLEKLEEALDQDCDQFLEQFAKKNLHTFFTNSHTF